MATPEQAATEESWMADEDVRAQLAGIASDIGHLRRTGQDTLTGLQAVRTDVSDLKAQTTGQFERLGAEVRALDGRVQRHEEDDERRFQSIFRKLDGLPLPETLKKPAAMLGGGVTAGGAIVWGVMELLRVLRDSGAAG